MTKVVDIDCWWYKKLANKYRQILASHNRLEAEKYVSRFLSKDPDTKKSEAYKVKAHIENPHQEC